MSHDIGHLSLQSLNEVTAADTRPSAYSSLLRPELAPLAEVWKLAYADFLLRAGLVGRRAAILQYEFAPVEGAARHAASGDLPLQGLVLANVCRFCNERVLLPDQVRCSECARFHEPPLCVVCRLPIKGESQVHPETSSIALTTGLSSTCTSCSHTSHTKCLRDAMQSPSHHCPACLCFCLAERGLSGGFATRSKPAPSTAISYGWPTALQRLAVTSPTRLQFDGPHNGASDFVRAVDREPDPEPEPSPPREWWNPLSTDNPAKVVSYLKHLRPVDTGGSGAPAPVEAVREGGGGMVPRGGGGIWGGMGGGGLDIMESPGDELRMGLSGLGPTHHARRATFTYGAEEAPSNQPEEGEEGEPQEDGLLARTRLRTLGREGLLGW